MATAEAGHVSTKNPFESYIADRIKYRTVRPQFVISFVAGLAFSFEMIGIYILISPTNAMNLYGGGAIILALMYTMVPLLIWFASSLLTFLITRLVLGARADFGVLYRTNGWAMLPFVGTTASLSIGRFLVLRRVATDPCATQALTCDLTEFVTEAEQADGLSAFAHLASSDLTFQLFYAIAMAFLVLTGYLMIIATDESTTLTRAGATLVAGIPIVLLGIIMTVFTF